jgi:serine protease Do
LSAGSFPLVAQSAERGLDTRTYIDVSHQVLPSVVSIAVQRKAASTEAEDEDTSAPGAPPGALLDYFREQEDDGDFLSSGSGVVVRVEGNRGFVVTNNHVIQAGNNRTQTLVRFHRRPEGSTEYSETTELVGENVRLVGRDKLSDLAVLEVDLPPGFTVEPVRFADSDKTEIGEHIVALGNPLDLNHTVTTGIISGKARALGAGISIERLLQTNAVIQPGNSGGPLVNLDGALVGINNAIASRNGLWQGTSFAIPSNDVKRISDQLIDRGRVARGYLGVNMRDVFMTPSASRYRLTPEEGGVLLLNVVPKSPADVAGIETGDVVITIDGQPVRTSDDMLQAIATKPVDSSVEVGVVRLGETKDAEPFRKTFVARLTERPDEELIDQLHQPQQSMDELFPDEELPSSPLPSPNVVPTLPVRGDLLGLAVKPYFDPATRLSGVEIEAVATGSATDLAGLRSGDIVSNVNGRSVRSEVDLRAALSAGTDPHTFQVLRGGVSQLVLVEE